MSATPQDARFRECGERARRVRRLGVGARRSLAPALLAVCAASAVAACGATPARDGAEPPAAPAAWQLASGTGPEGAIPLTEGYPITLRLEDDELGGTAGCNSYGATVRIDGERIELDELSQTEMACEAEAMASEAAYLQALQRVERVRRRESGLVLGGPSVELRFEPLPPVPTEELRGTTWELDTLLSGETASTPSAPGSTLLLRADGSLEGHTGCREFSGEYAVRGDQVRVTRLAMDEHTDVEVCSAGAQEQDRLVAEVLGDGFRAQVEGNRLTLTSPGGNGLGYRGR